MFIGYSISSTFSISAGNTSSIACTALSAIAVVFRSAGLGCAADAAAAPTTGSGARLGLRRPTVIFLPATADGDLLEPLAILLELLAQHPVRRQERERHAVGTEFDLLRLRDDRVVERGLRLADLEKEGVPSAFARSRTLAAFGETGADRRRSTGGTTGAAFRSAGQVRTGAVLLARRSVVAKAA